MPVFSKSGKYFLKEKGELIRIITHFCNRLFLIICSLVHFRHIYCIHSCPSVCHSSNNQESMKFQKTEKVDATHSRV